MCRPTCAFAVRAQRVLASLACGSLLVGSALGRDPELTGTYARWVPGPPLRDDIIHLPSVLGGKLAPCGEEPSCAFSGDVEERLVCVQPPALTARPFCLSVLKLGRYIAGQPRQRVSGASLLHPRCSAVPEALVFSDFADAHLPLAEYLAAASYICEVCGASGEMRGWPRTRCLLIGRGSTLGTTLCVGRSTVFVVERPVGELPIGV